MKRRITHKKIGQYCDVNHPLNDSGIELNKETGCRKSLQPRSQVSPDSPTFQEIGSKVQSKAKSRENPIYLGTLCLDRMFSDSHDLDLF